MGGSKLEAQRVVPWIWMETQASEERMVLSRDAASGAGTILRGMGLPLWTIATWQMLVSLMRHNEPGCGTWGGKAGSQNGVFPAQRQENRRKQIYSLSFCLPINSLSWGP